MPHFQKAYETYGDEYNFIFVNYLGFYGETEEDALAYLADNGYTFSTYFDHDQVGAYTYGIYSIPTTAFFSADGEFLGGVQGAMSEAALEYYIAEYFGWTISNTALFMHKNKATNRGSIPGSPPFLFTRFRRSVLQSLQ